MSDARPSDRRPSREDVAHAEIGHTDIHPAAARWTTWIAALGLALVPIAQVGREIAQYRRGDRSTPWPTITSLGPVLADAVISWNAAPQGWRNRLLEANHVLRLGLKRYEDDLEEASWFRARVQPLTQLVLSRVLATGNEPTQIGRHGVLYYGPELDHLAGPGFLNPATMARRRREGDRWTPAPEPDSVTAIVDFRDQLATRGIHLVLVPVPVKTGAWPAGFTRRSLGQPPLHNRSWPEWRAALERHGVDVVDLDAVLRALPPDVRTAPYLKTDTHWRPETMECVARAIAERVQAWLGERTETAGYTAHEVTVTNRGDLAVMLNLPDTSAWPPPDIVTVRQVRRPDGRPWAPDPTADTLLLGDSFANIFSLESMRWGAAAGLAEHIALALQRPVDRMVRNDAGAFATRQMLFGEVRRRPDRLATTRVVVWQFSERELSFGDWKRLSWPEASPPTARSATPP